jgi:hypothetical protein
MAQVTITLVDNPRTEATDVTVEFDPPYDNRDAGTPPTEAQLMAFQMVEAVAEPSDVTSVRGVDGSSEPLL